MRTAALALLIAPLLTMGCREHSIHFPSLPVGEHLAAEAGADVAWDTNGDGKGDYFYQYGDPGPDGAAMVWRIGYDRDGDAKPDEWIIPSQLDRSGALHLVVILDGINYDVASEYYKQGGLRLLHPPSRVIAPYPTMTDMCLEDMLNHVPVAGFEAEYYDPENNAVIGGKWAYITGSNQPYNQLLNYRANLIWDAVGYVFPSWVFRREMDHAKRQLELENKRDFLAYFVSTAGVGTKKGKAGHVQVLQDVQRLVNQVIWERRGLAHVTIVTDHGHTYTQAVRAPLDTHLKERGWDLGASLTDDDDVVLIEFGLVTYASASTRRPARLAADLAEAEGVDLVSYPERYAPDSAPDQAQPGPATAAEPDTPGDTDQAMRLVVLSGEGGKALIYRRLGSSGRLVYEPVDGDPLKLKGLLPSGPRDNTYYAADSLDVTVQHEYPAPLERLWRAHFGLVKNPPNVIVSLKDGYYYGSEGFAGFVDVASTHGGLNRINSTAFIMSTLPLPALMRTRDIPAVLREATGREFPPAR